MKWDQINVSGAISSASGIFLLVLGILLLNDPKNWNIALIPILIGIILLIIFYFDQQKKIKEKKTPLLDITLFQDRTFTLGNISRLIMNFTIGGVLFIIPVYIQIVLGADPLTTGLSLIPMSVSIFILSFTAGKVSTRLEPRYILSLGFISAIAGSIYLNLIFSPYTTILDMMPGIALLGVGMGIVFPHSANAIFSVARNEQQPDASGVMNTGINLGSALGTAALGVILILGSFGSIGAASVSQTNPNVNVHISDVPSKLGIGGSQGLKEANLGTNPNNYKKINAMKDSFNLITIALLIGLISALFIPNPKKKIKNVKGHDHCPI